MTLRLRRGTNLERQSIIFQEGELVYITDTNDLYAGDGTTVGGIKVSNVGSPSSLTQGLNLNGYNIQGSGTISATSFFGDGSGLTGIDTGGIQEGQEYNIDIRGNVKADDSTLLVDANAGAFFGTFVGDGSLISNIAINQLDEVEIFSPQDGDVLAYSNGLWINSQPTGIVEGSDYAINIVGIDSSLIVNSNNGQITPTEITYNTSGGLRIKATDNNQSEVRLFRTTVLPSDSIGVVGILYFDALLSDNQESTVAFVYSGGTEELGNDYITGFLELNVVDSTGTVTENNALLITGDGKTGLGTYNPTERLDVRGNGIFTGDVTAAAFKGSLMADDSTTIINGVDGSITASSFVQFGSLSTVERNLLLATNGMVIYNTTDNKFQGYQNNAWINLDNGSAA